MNRRDLLLRGGLTVGLVACSGCTEQALEEAESQPPLFDDVDEEAVDLPVRRKFGIAEAGVRQADGTTLANPEELASYLDDQGLHVESIEETTEHGEELLELEYADAESTDRGVLYGLGRVSGGYAALLAGDYEVDKLDASILDPGGEKFGTFDVHTEWVEAYLDGQLSAAEYAGEVLHTLEAET